MKPAPLAAALLAAALLAARANDLAAILAPVTRSPAAAEAAIPAAAPFVPAPAQALAADQIIDEKAVIAALQAEISARFGLDGELRLAFAQPWASVRVPAGEWKIVMSQLPSGELDSSFLVRFHVDAGGRRLGDWQAVLRAQLWRTVRATARRIDRGQPLDSSLVTEKPIDALREKQSLVPVSTDLSLYETAQALGEDHPLAWRDVTLRPLVRKGQTVEVLVNDGSLNISMKGQALGSGGLGEAIVVRNTDSRRDFYARVIRPNTVQVQF